MDRVMGIFEKFKELVRKVKGKLDNWLWLGF